MQVVLVYLQRFRRNSLLKNASQPEIAKKLHENRLFWGCKVVQGHRCWYSRKPRQQCLLWYAASLCLSATVLKSRWLGKIPSQVGDKPVCVVWNLWTSATRHDKRTLAHCRLVTSRNGEVVDFLVSCCGDVTGLSRGSRHNGIRAFPNWNIKSSLRSPIVHDRLHSLALASVSQAA